MATPRTTEPGGHRPIARAWVALGANLGDPRSAVLRALNALAQLPQSRRVAASSLYKTEPVDAGGPDFINAVAELETQLAPLDLLDALQALERDEGRERPYRNAPRTLDLDLLRYDDPGEIRMHSERLTLPHPRMNERAFVLVPLAEIAPQLVGADALARVDGQRIERL